MKGIFIYILVAIVCSSTVKSQSLDSVGEMGNSHEFTILSGLIQPLLFGGGNIAGTYFSNKLTFEYSHGAFLTYPKFLRKDGNLTSLYSKWSTGAGIGYRLSTNRDLRLEVKAHNYEADLINDQEIEYTAYSLGVGIYSRKYLWESNWLIEYSLRYWPNISSTLPEDQFQYNDQEGINYVHKAHQLGLIFNISVGYTFKKNKS